MKIALIGLGRTGKIVAKYMLEQGVLQAVFCRLGSKQVGLDLGDVLGREKTGVVVTPVHRMEEQLAVDPPTVLIDFSGPGFLREYIEVLERCGVHVVTAVTDYTDLDIEKFRHVGERARIGVMFVPNITYGVNVMLLLAQLAAKMMGDYDFEIIEEHHNRKKDIPSGTAKKVARKIEKIFHRCCDGEKLIPVHSIRSGGIVGKHKLIIAGKYDKIEISHESISRTAFAEGAYKAACFVQSRKGYYEMEDVFAERNRRQAILPNSAEVLPAI